MAARHTRGDSLALSRLIGRERAGNYADTRVSGLALDSRQLRPGDLFLAISGSEADGRDYIGEARAAGAAAVVAERGLTDLQRAAARDLPVVELENLDQEVGDIAARFFGRPGDVLHLVGVTGTNGKTTTSRLVAQLLRAAPGDCGVIGTLGATLDNSADESANTTPDAVSLQRQLANWRDAGVARAALEVSSHALVQGRVNGVAFDSAIFTNLSHDHLDYHGDMESYGLAKSLLFSRAGLRTAIVNADDPFSGILRQRVTGSAELIRYSIRDRHCELSVSDTQYTASGVRAVLHTPWGEGELDSPLAGPFNLSNLLAAIAAAGAAGIALERILESVARLQPVPGRLQAVAPESGLHLYVDYAHTPHALEEVLLALRRHTRGRLVCVFGCGGDRDPAKRPMMGRIATTLADLAIITSDNPRREDPLAIIADIQAGCTGDVVVEPDRGRAIERAVAELEAGDVLLVAGKGHETYQLVGDRRLDFDDARVTAAAALRRAGS